MRSDLLKASREEFMEYLFNVLLKREDAMPFVFPISGVLPGTLLSVPSVPVEVPHTAIGKLGLRGVEQGMPVSPASPVPLQDFSLVIGELSPNKSQGSPVLLGTPRILEDIGPSSPMIISVLPEWPTLDFEELGPYDKGPSPTSHAYFPDFSPVLLGNQACSPDNSFMALESPDCSLASPTYSMEFFPFL